MDALMLNLSVLWNWSSFKLKRQQSVGLLPRLGAWELM